MLKKGIKQVARGQCGIHERSGERFLDSSSEVEHDGHSFARLPAVVTGKEVAGDQFDIIGSAKLLQNLVQTAKLAGRPNETPQDSGSRIPEESATTLAPMKPLEPVISIRSAGKAM